MQSEERWLSAREPRGFRAVLVGLTLAQAALIIGQAWLLSSVIGAVLAEGRSLGGMAPALVGLLAVLLGRAALDSARSWYASGVSVRVRADLRPRLFRQIARAGPGYASGAGAGALTTTLIEQVDLLEKWYGRFLPQRIAASVTIPVLLLAVLWQDWLAGLFLALAAPLIPLFMVLVGWGAEQASREQQHELVRLGGVFLDRLRGLDTIRRFGSEEHELNRLGQLIERFRERTFAVLKIAFLSSAVLEFFSAVAIAAVAIYVGLGLLEYIQFGPASSLTLQSGLFVLLLAPEFFLPLRQLSQAWHDRADSLAAADGILKVLETPPARPEPERPVRIEPERACRVEARNLTLSRAGRGTVLDRVAFRAEPGERLLIRGPSGGGKSTLLDLVGGFLAPDSGTIRIDGIDLDRIDSGSMTMLRGWMGQQGGLFEGTLADNLRLAAPDASEAALASALSAAGLQDWTNGLPHGLHTPIRSSGEGISGGQARRILLARALLRPRPLLLLDEPTASLDAETAAKLWETLADLARDGGPTMVCASHDPAASEWADRTLELAGGRLTEITP
ncbi:thiol reductant ABC exporter subunit CydD [Wenzhouxiangella sediminis]|uniref:Thiol reductant ABC exporter subunit CydD n=1 Tax=Wenzhouxiangella sediminis TaxID=1792836 RepID=A0A3E1KDE3_9GAMM|nr:thiol reductant ABC exporter subunit CydD [Wenzhouxiangella sediminis]RFF32345.1 thiol reductant ABC exporter subunit CydD [Wenzhouxiangella sediminis]